MKGEDDEDGLQQCRCCEVCPYVSVMVEIK
jgi:hypothetical protein